MIPISRRRLLAALVAGGVGGGCWSPAEKGLDEGCPRAARNLWPAKGEVAKALEKDLHGDPGSAGGFLQKKKTHLAVKDWSQDRAVLTAG